MLYNLLLLISIGLSAVILGLLIFIFHTLSDMLRDDSKPTRKERKAQKKTDEQILAEMQREIDIAANIDAYDGTPNGQKEIK